ncbi:MAG TPA: ABC transporter substrate-binding protein, partial [Pseudomonas sp.]|nr:ABC transporter substrate-binding protein [Pseudomonas sp.]
NLRNLAAVLLGSLLALPALADTRQVEDAFGNAVTVPAEPQRVITLSES